MRRADKNLYREGLRRNLEICFSKSLWLFLNKVLKKFSSEIQELLLGKSFFENKKSLTLNQYESLAFKKLDYPTYCFFSGGSSDEITLRSNLLAYDHFSLIPRVLRNSGEFSLSSSLLGNLLSFPLIVAPMAFQKLAHSEGEVATAKAVSNHDLLMTVSTCSTSSLKEIRDASRIPPWFQVYVYKDRHVTKNLIEKVTSLNYGAIVLTVDAPLYSKRLREKHFPLSFPDSFSFPDLLEAGLTLEGIKPSQVPKFLSEQLDASLSWKDIDWIRSLTNLPIILKGVLHPKDLEIAKMEGIKTVILSNNGGRQLDTSITSLKALEMLGDTLKADMDIIVDGGVRKGTDLLKGIALGAKALMVGRPVLWGLSANGEKGVYDVLDILKKELEIAMILSGARSINNISAEIIFKNER